MTINPTGEPTGSPTPELTLTPWPESSVTPTTEISVTPSTLPTPTGDAVRVIPDKQDPPDTSGSISTSPEEEIRNQTENKNTETGTHNETESRTAEEKPMAKVNAALIIPPGIDQKGITRDSYPEEKPMTTAEKRDWLTKGILMIITGTLLADDTLGPGLRQLGGGLKQLFKLRTVAELVNRLW